MFYFSWKRKSAWWEISCWVIQWVVDRHHVVVILSGQRLPDSCKTCILMYTYTYADSYHDSLCRDTRLDAKLASFRTCRSDNNRSRAPSCQCIVDAGRDDNDTRNYLIKIEVKRCFFETRDVCTHSILPFIPFTQFSLASDVILYKYKMKQVYGNNTQLKIAEEVNMTCFNYIIIIIII